MSAYGDPGSELPLKPLDFSVLLVLSEGPEYGYGMVKRIALPEWGGIRLAPSNLYYVLDRLAAAGLVEETESESGELEAERRRYWGLTERGRLVAAAEARRLAALVRAAERVRLLARGET